MLTDLQRMCFEAAISKIESALWLNCTPTMKAEIRSALGTFIGLLSLDDRARETAEKPEWSTVSEVIPETITEILILVGVDEDAG